ncbi:MAG: hypothetical protein H7270_02010 [Dermatophilaceae bacterium]|nr:hypothetical protein [Dermatophilaceae bacterium]
MNAVKVVRFSLLTSFIAFVVVGTMNASVGLSFALSAFPSLADVSQGKTAADDDKLGHKEFATTSGDTDSGMLAN